MKRLIVIAPLLIAACQTSTVNTSLESAPASGPMVAPMSVELGGPTSVAGTTVRSAEDAASIEGGAFVGTSTIMAGVGDPVKPGLWVETPLVTVPMRGKATVTGSGASVLVQLLPPESTSEGASKLSMETMRALNLNLMDTVEIEISAP